jgi:outer membrane lipoprotein SlyB
MKNLNSVFTAMSAAAILLAGCAAPETQPYYSSQSQTYPSQGYPQARSQNSIYGVVDRIEVVNKGDSNNIAGTVIGGIIGGLIGHQIGGGTGNTVATIAGAAGGAYAGNQIQKRSRAANETFRVTVRMDDGSWQTITQDNITDLQPGDRVRLEGDRIYRV